MRKIASASGLALFCLLPALSLVIAGCDDTSKSAQGCFLPLDNSQLHHLGNSGDAATGAGNSGGDNSDAANIKTSTAFSTTGVTTSDTNFGNSGNGDIGFGNTG